jgi:hypothetical protein
MTNRREILKLFSIGSAALPLTKFVEADAAVQAAATARPLERRNNFGGRGVDSFSIWTARCSGE